MVFDVFFEGQRGETYPPEFYIYSGPKRPDKVTKLFTTARAQAGVKSASIQRRASKGEKRREREKKKSKNNNRTTIITKTHEFNHDASREVNDVTT